MPFGVAFRIWLPLFMAIPWMCLDAHGQSNSIPVQAENARIDRLERLLEDLAERNRQLTGEIRGLKQSLEKLTPEAGTGAKSQVLPNLEKEEQETGQDLTETYLPRYTVTYDHGFLLAPEDFAQSPFTLKFNNQNMFRYDGFARSREFWVDSAGNKIPIDNSSYFGIPRGRLIFSGQAFFEDLHYLINIDYNTVTSNPIGFRAYVFSYRFNQALELSAGQNKVPGSREWLESSFSALQGPDRSMATTFFRPSLSQGIWATGEPVEGWHYYAMWSNGFNTQNLLPTQLFEKFCLSGSTWLEPLGEYGPGYSDIQGHENLAVRLGASYTFDLGQGPQNDSDAVENSSVRLTDGTLITQKGAFAPGVTLNYYDISLASLDLGLKYRGLGLSSEIYFQDLLNLRGNGPIPINSTQAFGGFIQGGYFILPGSLEFYAKSSMVTGAYGSGTEVGGGINWFVLNSKSNMRCTVDAASLNGSPADQNRTGYVAGQTGLLLRTQIMLTY